MKRHSSQSRTLTAAQRGAIVQRVIVDGWTPAEAAAAAGLPERLVADWVADFRRRGMVSLRSRPSKTAAISSFGQPLAHPSRVIWRRLMSALRWLFALEPRVPTSPIRHSRDDRRGGP
jgi:leucine-zipper of insertion element IS481